MASFDTPNLTRRDYLKTSLGAVAAAGLAARGIGAEDARPPNILVIMSDEHNAGVLGAHGNTLARTPHLDALAARGTVFENAYCNSPLCVPSRLSFTSGKYVSRVSAWSNACWLPGNDFPTLPNLLNAQGYETVLCGKMHYDRSHRYGFRTQLEPQNLNEGDMTGLGGRRKADDLVPKPGIAERFSDFHTGDDSSCLSHDRRLTEEAGKFLRARKASDKPFFLLAGYITPHFPLIVPEKYFKNFEGKVPPPNIPEGHLEQLALNWKHLRIGFNVEDAPADIVKKGRELYHGLVEWFDEQAGELLKSLADSEVADNTVVIYTSDHGENMGEHGLWWKNAAYEHSSHVPLIVSWPSRWSGGARRSGVCSLVDVVQTISAMSGATAPSDWDGDSLLPLLDDGAAPWKDFAVIEYYAHNIASGYVALRSGPFKYVYHTAADDQHPAHRELYDLSTDPAELKNLAELPEYQDTLNKLHERLLAELGEDPEITEQRSRRELAKGYGRVFEGKPAKGEA